MKDNQIITREVFVRSMTEELIENRQAEFVISTEAVDSHGTVFKMDGWDLERYQQNPIVLYHHDSYSSNPDVIIGTSEVRIEADQMIARVTFEEADSNPLAEKVYQKVKNGILRMASIGARIMDYRWGVFEDGENPDVIYFTRQQLLEWSIVPIGSNPEALTRSRDFLEEIKKESKPEINNTKKRSLAVTEADVELKLKMFK